MADFTPAQGRYLAFIQATTQLTGRAPAQSQIAAALGVTPSSVNQMMKGLERKGLIRRQTGLDPDIEVLVDPDCLPEWDCASAGSASTKVQSVKRDRDATSAEEPCTGDIYCLKIVLLGTHPPIWRTIETRDTTLAEVHELIQIAMGWENCHLHMFRVANEIFMDDEAWAASDDGDEAYETAKTHLSSLVDHYGPKLIIHYEYDFGDNWKHQIRLTGMTNSDPKVRYPRCVGGERACPPEDIGGVHGFIQFLEQREDREMRDEIEEIYGPFDPEQFDAAKVTARMNRRRRQRKAPEPDQQEHDGD